MDDRIHSSLSLQLRMVKKRRNNGRSKHNCGHTKNVRCNNCSRCVAKDKAVKRFIVRNIVDAASLRDMADASVYKSYEIPKVYYKQFWCVSCAIHHRIVRVRSSEGRRERMRPRRRFTRQQKK
ncbi:Ribosomal protein S26e like protein [Aduncisulcus paluster]|uniref:40S ribosomal protein S26 n=1 Tax=Aduncisulcus paluster TaxID=2918883 RepID=A0ABQ5KJY9_9EUKA|nr:Ribosomal protein S26e like protein [Aduncisulcus paluster]